VSKHNVPTSFIFWPCSIEIDNIPSIFFEKSKGLFFAPAHGPTRHQTASAHDLLTFRRLPDSIRKPSGKGAQRLALPPDHLGAHVCFSNSQVPGIVAQKQLQSLYKPFTGEAFSTILHYLKDIYG
jgi:hypothetical protein